ncbi:MAG: type II secretion system F family protein [Acidobacteriota bacterium]|jgi:type IV pilus assembly protein PilC
MPDFLCKVGTPTGEIVERVYSAANEKILRKDLGDKELLILSVRRRGGLLGMLPGLGGPRRGKIKVKEFLIFNQELAALLKAGMPILGSLDILIERRKNPVFKAALTDIRDQVRGGASLSDAFASHGDLFPPIYGSSLASGERSGEIVAVLLRYIKYTKTLLALRKKVVSAMVYPALLAFLSLGLIALLVLYVLPKFSEFFTGMNTDLPMLTVVLLNISLFVRSNMLLILGAAAIAIAAFSAWKRTSVGEMQLDRMKMSLPMVGKIIQKYAVSAFSRTLGTLLAGGIPLVQALDIAAGAVSLRLFQTRLAEVATRIREGKALWESLDATGLLTEMAIEMIRVGEQTGSLESMLIDISDFYDEEIDSDLQTIIALLEPLMLIFMGIVIATILMAIYLPMFRSYSAAQT